MKAVIAILIIAGVAFGGYKVWEYWDTMKESEGKRQTAASVEVSPDKLTGLPQKLEPTLQEAQKGGAKTLKAWLDKIKPAGLVKDPRLASIELDYVLMITKDDPIEAKRIFHQVKDRTPADSPLYPRIKALEKTYE
jgi:hypothetical protein